MCIKIGVIDLILKKLIIKNYRNFSEININLNNRNAIFGMNDVGKTNLLQAIRTVFDRNIRSNGFVASDYHKNDTSKPIEIIVEFDLSDREEESEQGIDSKILITKVYNARNNMNSPDSFAIKLEGIYDENEFFGNPILTWGSTTDNLEPIPNRGQSFIIDSIFHVEYVYPNSDLDYCNCQVELCTFCQITLCTFVT
jgi:putative ATP-dependent endonuclease of OLD family